MNFVTSMAGSGLFSSALFSIIFTHTHQKKTKTKKETPKHCKKCNSGSIKQSIIKLKNAQTGVSYQEVNSAAFSVLYKDLT